MTVSSLHASLSVNVLLVYGKKKHLMNSDDLLNDGMNISLRYDCKRLASVPGPTPDIITDSVKRKMSCNNLSAAASSTSDATRQPESTTQNGGSSTSGSYGDLEYTADIDWWGPQSIGGGMKA